MFAEWIVSKKPTTCSAYRARSPAWSPSPSASGFVDPNGAFIIAASPRAVELRYPAWWVPQARPCAYDDSLDAFGVHGVGGFIGAILTGVFADAAINSAGKVHSPLTQFYGCLGTILWSERGSPS